MTVTGWTDSDLANHVIIIPPGYSIEPSSELRIYTGTGDSTSTRCFVGGDQAIWNNVGDTAVLRDPTGAVIDQYSY